MSKDKEFLKKNPVGKAPMLETPDGILFESNAIMRHFGRNGLYGVNEYEMA
jgi:elongation factor 1-gamma